MHERVHVELSRDARAGDVVDGHDDARGIDRRARGGGGGGRRARDAE